MLKRDCKQFGRIRLEPWLILTTNPQNQEFLTATGENQVLRFPDSVVGFLPSERVRTEYLQSWLGFLQPTLEANAPQAAQKNINLEILRNLPVPLPPLDLQDLFEQRCRDVFSIQSQQSAAIAKAKAAFDALLAQMFDTVMT